MGRYRLIAQRIKGGNVVLAEDQPEYHKLPARVTLHSCGHYTFTTAWEPTPDELERLNKGAHVELCILGNAHPPIMVNVGEVPTDDV
jgi:hypothetical protein